MEKKNRIGCWKKMDPNNQILINKTLVWSYDQAHSSLMMCDANNNVERNHGSFFEFKK